MGNVRGVRPMPRLGTTVLAVLQLLGRLSESLPAIDNLFYISLGPRVNADKLSGCFHKGLHLYKRTGCA